MTRLYLAAAAALGVTFGAQAQTIKIAILGPMAFVQGEHHWYGAEMARDAAGAADPLADNAHRLGQILGADHNQRDHGAEQ